MRNVWIVTWILGLEYQKAGDIIHPLRLKGRLALNATVTTMDGIFK